MCGESKKGEKERKQRSRRVSVGDVWKQQVINRLKSFYYYSTCVATKTGQYEEKGENKGLRIDRWIDGRTDGQARYVYTSVLWFNPVYVAPLGNDARIK